jgi:hypothetical protein
MDASNFVEDTTKPLVAGIEEPIGGIEEPTSI